MSKKSPTFKKSQTLPTQGLNTSSHSRNQSGELKVCGDCQVRHSHKMSNQSDPGLRRSQTGQKGRDISNKDDFQYSGISGQEMRYTPGIVDNERDTNYDPMDYRKSPNPIGSQVDQKISQEQSETGSRGRNLNKDGQILRVNDLISKDERSRSNHRRNNKLFAGESPINKAPETQNSFATSFQREVQYSEGYARRKNFDFKGEDALGEERFIRYSKDLDSELDKVTLKLESNLKKNFDQATHNLLLNHVNKQSLLDTDESFRMRDTRSRMVTEGLEYSRSKSPQDSRQYSQKIDSKFERSYISDGPSGKKYVSPSRIEGQYATMPTSSPEKWTNMSIENKYKTYASPSKVFY